MGKDRTKWFCVADKVLAPTYDTMFLCQRTYRIWLVTLWFCRCKFNNYNWYNQLLLLILTFIFITFNSYRCIICKILKFSFGLYSLKKSKNDIQSPFFQKTPKNEKSINLKKRSKVQAKSTLWPTNEYFKKWFNFLIFRYLSIKSLKMG